jgi:hypothetical protein
LAVLRNRAAPLSDHELGPDLNHAREVDADAVTAPRLLLIRSETNNPLPRWSASPPLCAPAACDVLERHGHGLIGEPAWQSWPRGAEMAQGEWALV